MDAIRKAAEHVGGQAKLAHLINVSPQAINQWCKGVRPLPGEQVIPICNAVRGAGCQITPHELRPDLYPDPNWLPPTEAAA